MRGLGGAAIAGFAFALGALINSLPFLLLSIISFSRGARSRNSRRWDELRSKSKALSRGKEAILRSVSFEANLVQVLLSAKRTALI